MVEPAPHYGHERADLAWRSVLVTAAIVAVSVVAVVAAIHYALRDWAAPRHAQIEARVGVIPPPPRLQAHARRDLAALREQKETLLSTYGWADQQKNLARIPIERAMALYVRQDSRTATAGSAATGSSASTAGSPGPLGPSPTAP